MDALREPGARVGDNVSIHAQPFTVTARRDPRRLHQRARAHAGGTLLAGRGDDFASEDAATKSTSLSRSRTGAEDMAA